MTRPARVLNAGVRSVLAVVLSLSWLVATGLPAAAIPTNAYVSKPAPSAILSGPKNLVIVVERSAPPPAEEETIKVRSDLYFAPGAAPAPQPTEPPAAGSEVSANQQQPSGEPQKINDKSVPIPELPRPKDDPNGFRERRFGLSVDPYALAWMPDQGVAPNGRYLLRYRTISDFGDSQPQEWQPYEFRIDADPPEQAAPLATRADASTKRITISWAANAAPDVTSYTVERQHNDGEWKVANANIKPAERNGIQETVKKFGTYRYRVTAFRPAGDGSPNPRSTVSAASAPVELTPAATEQPTDTPTDDPTVRDPNANGGDGSGTGGGSGGPANDGAGTNTGGFGTDTQPFTPGIAAPEGFDDTYRGPLDYGVEPRSVTERVPVDIARGGAAAEESTLEILDRAIDQKQVLPPVAGGLILVISAAHVLRYLNE